MQRYTRGTNPNSLKALEENRAKGVITRQIKKEKRELEKELQKRNKTLDLEVKMYKLRKEKEYSEKIDREYENSFYPLDRTKLKKVIKNLTI